MPIKALYRGSVHNPYTTPLSPPYPTNNSPNPLNLYISLLSNLTVKDQATFDYITTLTFMSCICQPYIPTPLALPDPNPTDSIPS